VFVLWLVWAVLTGATGSQSPLFVAREDIGHSFARGDLLVLQWGKAAFENLRAGEVLVYHQMAGDPLPTLTRITAIHKVLQTSLSLSLCFNFCFVCLLGGFWWPRCGGRRDLDHDQT
jgi:hypothetical protein